MKQEVESKGADMKKFIRYVVAKIFEISICSILITSYFLYLHPVENFDFFNELKLGVYVVLVFFIFGLYFLTSLLVHLKFSEAPRFGVISVVAYLVSLSIFLLLFPVAGLENLVIFAFAPLVVFISAKSSRLIIT